MDLGLKGKVALITGAGMGIGKATSFSLAREGGHLAVCDIDRNLVEQSCQKLKECGVRVFPIQVDCTELTSIREMVKKAIEEFGRIDILVNSVGDPKTGTLLSLTEKDWEVSIRLKLLGTIFTITEVYPHMKRDGGGRIVNIIGVFGKQPAPTALTAGVTNAGLMAFTKALAQGAAADNILVNGVSPGPTETLRVQRVIEKRSQERGISIEQAKEEFLNEVPLRRMAKPEEVGDFIAFVVSDKASYLTGEILTFDGGFVRSI